MQGELTKRLHAMAYVRNQIATREVLKADLEQWAAEIGLRVEGTGSKGKVTRADLLAAFEG